MPPPEVLPTPLDLGYDYGASGGDDDFGVDVVRTVSGRRQVNVPRSMPLGEWQVGNRNYEKATLDVLRAHWRVAGGPASVWPFKDWADYDAVDSPVTMLTASTGQLYKRYSVGAYSHDKKIVFPEVATLSFKLNGSPLTVASVDALTGIVTFNSPYPGFEASPPDVVTWSGRFYKPAAFKPGQRFDPQFLGYEARDSGDLAVYSLASLMIEEVLR